MKLFHSYIVRLTWLLAVAYGCLTTARAQIEVVSNGNVGIGNSNPQAKLQVGTYNLIKDGTWAPPVTPGTTSIGERIVFYEGSDWKTAIGMDGQNGIWFQAHTPPGQAAFQWFTGGQAAAPTGKMVLTAAGDLGIGTTAPVSRLHVMGVIAGGFGAESTGGVADWNDVSNARSGGGRSLLLGSAANGPVAANAYFHPFNFEYASKDGSGSITQLAIPYAHSGAIDLGIWMRGRYWSDPWGPWVRILSENTQGRVGIGTTSPTQKLEVIGAVKATSFISATTSYADFVFDADYQLPPLSRIEAHIKEHGHLPGIPSEAEARRDGIDLAAMQVKLLQKIEELTLHQIRQEKDISALQEDNARLREQLALLKATR